MKQFIRDMQGALLAGTIIIFYFAVISLLHGVVPRYITRGRAVNKKTAQVEEKGNEMRGFTVTAYCPGRCCNGIWAGLTATGKSIDYYTKRNLNIAAVDPGVIPMGTRFFYGGKEYLAVDIGSKIRGKKIDLLVLNHEATYEFGVRKEQSIVVLPARPLSLPPSGSGLNGLTYRQEAPARRSVQ